LTTPAHAGVSEASSSRRRNGLSDRTKKLTKKKNAPLCLNFLTKKAPYKGPGADSEEKREPVSDITTAMVDSLKVLDLKRPIREADIRSIFRSEIERPPTDLVSIVWNHACSRDKFAK